MSSLKGVEKGDDRGFERRIKRNQESLGLSHRQRACPPEALLCGEPR